jgi:tol-pal system protein YbgF
MMLNRIAAGMLLAGTGLAFPAVAQQSAYDRPYDQTYDQTGYGVATLEERVAKLEKRLAGNTLIEMNNRVQQLQDEVLKLRGTVEELNHELETLRKQQRQMYTDLDQRLVKAATGPAVAAGAAPSETPGAATTAPPVVEGAAAGAVMAPPPAPPPPAPVDPAVRQAAYQKAFATLKDGNYPTAIKEFKNFIATYPTGDFADNAHYWLGETYYVSRDLNASRETFRKLINDFPQSGKVPDAILKLGIIDYDTGRYATAREQLNDVIKRYPDSSAAKLAQKRLDKMAQEKK